jgi:hypothetical protein
MPHDENPPTESPLTAFGDALTHDGERRREFAEASADNLRTEMERLSAEIRDLILAQPPTTLLGFLWANFFMATLVDSSDENGRPDSSAIEKFQFALEYVHAVWSCYPEPEAGSSRLDEEKAERLLQILEALRQVTMSYCMARSIANTGTEFGSKTPDVQFQAMSSWVLIRGHRYQVLEEEFFGFVLNPHNEALHEAYGVDASQIAAGIQAIASTMRTGFNVVPLEIRRCMTQCMDIAQRENISMQEAVSNLKLEDPSFVAEMEGAIKDLFFGGLCNLTRHTSLPRELLDDLSYTPGGNTEFYKDGAYSGTPLRTLPARVRPLIKLSNEHYATDGQFVRDSAYRAIQRGLLSRLPSYREEWNKKQKTLIEQAFPTIFNQQLSGAQTYYEVYFRDPVSGNWAETDLVAIVDDVLLVVEAKAGVAAMHSPATNFDRHARAIRELVIKAYSQCRRFIEYLAR